MRNVELELQRKTFGVINMEFISMTIEKLNRVIWRLQEMKTDEPKVYTHRQIRLAIMEECGTDDRTIQANLKKLQELHMLEKSELGKMRIILNVL